MKAEEEDHEEKEKEGKQDSKQTQEEEAETEEEEAYGALLCLFLTIDNTHCVCRVFIFKDTGSSPKSP